MFSKILKKFIQFLSETFGVKKNNEALISNQNQEITEKNFDQTNSNKQNLNQTNSNNQACPVKQDQNQEKTQEETNSNNQINSNQETQNKILSFIKNLFKKKKSKPNNPIQTQTQESNKETQEQNIEQTIQNIVDSRIKQELTKKLDAILENEESLPEELPDMRYLNLFRKFHCFQAEAIREFNIKHKTKHDLLFNQVISSDKYYQVFSTRLFEISDFIPQCAKKIKNLEKLIKDNQHQLDGEVLRAVESGEIKEGLRSFNKIAERLHKRIAKLETFKQKKEWDFYQGLISVHLENAPELFEFQNMVKAFQDNLANFEDYAYMLRKKIIKLEEDSSFIYQTMKSDWKLFKSAVESKLEEIFDVCESHFNEFCLETDTRVINMETSLFRTRTRIISSNKRLEKHELSLEKIESNPIVKLGSFLSKVCRGVCSVAKKIKEKTSQIIAHTSKTLSNSFMNLVKKTNHLTRKLRRKVEWGKIGLLKMRRGLMRGVLKGKGN